MNEETQGNEDIYLSVIIPAYNEESRLGETLDTIHSFLKQQPYTSQIIVVDDGSTDRTVEIAEEADIPELWIVKNERNMGKGAAIRNGIKAAEGEVVLFTDADNSSPIEEVSKLLEAINEGYDVAIGSRALPESNIEVHQPWHRETMGRIFNLLVRMIVLRGIKDTQCGFKLFKKEVARKAFNEQKLSGFAFDVEVLILARRHGKTIKEVPIRWINSPASRVSPLSDALKMFTDLIRLRRLYGKRY